MNINLHNYEEYLMLYLDNELSHHERIVVEQFISENAFALEAFEQLRGTILPNHIEAMPDKTALFQNQNTITQQNCSEWFLLYTDNELTLKERHSVETFVLQNPEVQPDFLAIKNCVLPLTDEVFENKKMLYRKERNYARYFLMRFSAAAILTGLFISGLHLFTSDNIEVVPIVQQKSKPFNKPSGQSHQNPEKSNQQNNPNNILELTASNKGLTANKEPIKKQSDKIVIKHSIEATGDKKNMEELIVNIEKNNEPQLAVLVVDEHNPGATNLSRLKEQLLVISHDDMALNSIIQKEADLKNNQKVLKEINTDDYSEPLYIGNIELNKNKVKNLFKAASKLFQPATNDSK